VLSLFALQVAASEMPKSSLSAECRVPAVLAFNSAINGVLKQSKKSGKDPEQLWSTNPAFRKWVNSPKSTLPLVEEHLRCYPSESLDEVRLLSVALSCLDLDSRLEYIRRVSQGPKNRTYEWATHYAVSPGDNWSTKLALSYSEQSVQSTLKEVLHAPNVTPGLQSMVGQILSGSSKSSIEKAPVKQLVTCSERAGK